ncbi:MAG: zinc ribbon domain-containing protein [Clostridia bacterium]|nr:zinc ribbon domain-containing protein [Clostridia bacterium]MBQ5757309.1 zinc ribbon domain-containing protein [Clostridia bacterium]
MKCKYCGGEVSLSEKYCPYCGRLNEQTAEHAEAMRQFRKDYAETKAGVMETTKRFSGTAANAVIIAILAILLVASIFIGNNAWDIAYQSIKSNAIRHEAEYSQIMDDYLRKEQFLEYHAFAEKRGTTMYSRDAFSSFRQISYVVDSYCSFYRALTDVICAEEYRNAEYRISSINNGLSNFYEQINDYRTRDSVEHTDLHDRAVEVMETNVGYLLDTYLSIGAEDVAEYKGATEGRRLTMIESAVRDRFGGAE